jgi:hypothetical protein
MEAVDDQHWACRGRLRHLSSGLLCRASDVEDASKVHGQLSVEGLHPSSPGPPRRVAAGAHERAVEGSRARNSVPDEQASSAEADQRRVASCRYHVDGRHDHVDHAGGQLVDRLTRGRHARLHDVCSGVPLLETFQEMGEGVRVRQVSDAESFGLP